MPLTTSYYLERAAEFEAFAPLADCGTRKEYLELAQRFRDVASRVGVSRMESDEEAVGLAQRTVGNASA
jgi:hypothetical protein